MCRNMINSGRLKKAYQILTNIVFPLLLILYSLRHICYGVEWTDTGYNYGNFRFLEHMDSMWMFSTYLANVIGRLFMNLPFGNTMLGMNVYTGLIVSLLAVWGYFFFTKKVKLPSFLVFIGEVIAIGLCWCPTSLLYNYLTYLFLFAAMICLYLALTEERAYLYIIAGILLGINIFVRFSNMAQMAFILVVWAYAIILKKPVKKVLKETGLCILGYVLGAGGVLLWIGIQYGLSDYVNAVTRLFEMTSSATDYTITSMVIYQLVNFWQNFIWLGKLLFFVLLGIAGFMVLPGRLVKLKKIGYILCVLPVFYWLMNQNMFNLKYSTKLSVFQWAVMLLSFTMITGVIFIFSKAKPEHKLLCGMSMLVIVITPLGSNNHLYSSINNLFFAAPVAIFALWTCLKRLPEKLEYAKGRIKLYLFPLKAMACMIIAMLIVQSIGFGFGYVFSESDGGENLHTSIMGNPVLKGMYTSPDRAEVLEELYTYVKDEKLSQREIILYGNIPALSYYLDMPFAISAWPDLASYTHEVMAVDMEKIESKILRGEEAPLILLEYSSEERLFLETDNKQTLLVDFINKYDYQKVFENEKFVLYLDHNSVEALNY